jgi:hypothetical protein
MFKRVVAAVAVIFMVGIVAVLIQSGQGAVEPPLPNPNGYDLIVEAATNCHFPPFDYNHVSDQELAGWVTQNQAALDMLRRGLALPCRLPPSKLESRELSVAVGKTRELAQLLVAEGHGFEQSGQPEKAARSCLDAIQMGYAIPQGGTMFHTDEGLSRALIGARALQTLKSKLNVQICREAALEITRDLHGLPSADEVIQRDRRELLKQAGTLGRAYLRVKWLLPQNDELLTEVKFRNKRQAQLATLDQLSRDLNERAQELDRAAKP